MNCTLCGYPVILIPSAAERAKKYGGSPEQYTKLFPEHSDCIIKKRNRETIELIRRRGS